MAKGSVLVLDDEQIVCERLGEYLRQRGYEVETFTDSQMALDRLGQRRFDVVITDLKMKGPDGLDVVHFVRQNHPGASMIIITGYASMEAAREAEYAGVYEFVTKPFRLEQMGKMVAKAARRSVSGRKP
ncbi:MAG: response regulator [Deltaproteobacteria bacterium]|nr:MAG: response regulator [Deltaproteobacteria bacterium]